MERAVSCDGPRIELTGTGSNCLWTAESLEIRVGRFNVGPLDVEFGRALRHGSRAAGPGFGGQPFHQPRAGPKSTELANSPNPCGPSPALQHVPMSPVHRTPQTGPLSLSSRTAMEGFIQGSQQPTASVQGCPLL